VILSIAFGVKYNYFKVTFFSSNKIILVDLIFCAEVTANVSRLVGSGGLSTPSLLKNKQNFG